MYNEQNSDVVFLAAGILLQQETIETQAEVLTEQTEAMESATETMNVAAETIVNLQGVVETLVAENDALQDEVEVNNYLQAQNDALSIELTRIYLRQILEVLSTF